MPRLHCFDGVVLRLVGPPLRTVGPNRSRRPLCGCVKIAASHDAGMIPQERVPLLSIFYFLLTYVAIYFDTVPEWMRKTRICGLLLVSTGRTRCPPFFQDWFPLIQTLRDAIYQFCETGFYWSQKGRSPSDVGTIGRQERKPSEDFRMCSS